MGGRARAEGDKGTSFLLWGPRCVLSQMFFSIQAMLISPACRWAEISVNVDTSVNAVVEADFFETVQTPDTINKAV